LTTIKIWDALKALSALLAPAPNRTWPSRAPISQSETKPLVNCGRWQRHRRSSPEGQRSGAARVPRDPRVRTEAPGVGIVSLGSGCSVRSPSIGPLPVAPVRANLKFGTIDGLGLLEGGNPAETREKRQFALKTATFQFEYPPNGNGGGGACRRDGRGRDRPPAW
jgi:hypothetical protein